MSRKLTIEEALESQGFYMSTTVGVSMFPLLRNRRDTILDPAGDGAA